MAIGLPRALPRRDLGRVAESDDSNGLALSLGPGVRFWIHPQIALGYTAQWTLSRISGSSFNNIPTGGTDVTATTMGFAGRFQILAIF